MNKPLELKVYDEKGNVVKTSKAEMLDLEFGSVRSLMELLNIDDVNDTGHLLRIIYNAWDEIIKILNKCFTDMEYEDWEHVKVKELLPIVVNILKYSFSEILNIPSDSKN